MYSLLYTVLSGGGLKNLLLTSLNTKQLHYQLLRRFVSINIFHLLAIFKSSQAAKAVFFRNIFLSLASRQMKPKEKIATLDFSFLRSPFIEERLLHVIKSTRRSILYYLLRVFFQMLKKFWRIFIFLRKN